MPTRKRRPVRLLLEGLEDRLNPAPTLIANVSLPGAYPQAGIYSPAPVVADLDNDGQQEILATGGNVLYAYKLNPANGQMFIDHTYSQGTPQGPLNSTPIAVNLPSGPAVFLGDGHGTVFGWDARTGNLLPGWPQTVDYFNAADPLPTETFAANQIYGGLAAGDLDGDGVPEIVATSLNHEITAFHADGQVMWRFNNDDTVFSTVAIGDLNADGLPEVVVGGDSSASIYYWQGGKISVLSWDGRREWVKQTDQVIWSSPALVDLNGDGTLEIIVGTGYNFPEPIPGHAPYPGNVVYGLDANGNDLPGWPYVTAPTSVDGRTRSLPAVADLNGDGKLDIAIVTAQGQLLAIDGNGQKLWNVQASNQTGLYPSPMIADVNNDGLPDVILMVPEGRVKAYSGPNGSPVWDYPDGYGHLTTPAVGHFRGDATWQLAMIGQQFNAQAQQLMTPSNLLVFELGASTLAPPWSQSRQDGSANAVARPDSFTTTYVNALYQGTLGRQPTAAELANWLPIYRRAHNLKTPTLQFLTSQEVRQAKLTSAYQTYLGRGVDPQGFAHWSGVLNSGQAYTFIQANLAASAESFNRAGGANPPWVTYLYQTVLGRMAGPSEVDYWVGRLNNGSTDRFQIALGILRAQESTNRVVNQWYAAYTPGGQATAPADSLAALGWDLRRGKSDETALAELIVNKGDYVTAHLEGSWLRAIYPDVLQRNASQSDVTYWLGTIERGASAEAVTSAFVRSPEYHRVLVRGWIQKLLGRGATASDQEYFGGLLDRGASWVSVQQIFISSNEYFVRAGNNVNGFINQVFIDQVGHPALAQQISFWSTQPNVRTLLPQILMTTQEYYNYVIGGETYSSWFGRFLRRFANTQPDLSRVTPIGTPPESQGLANAWAAGARPDDLLVLVLNSPEYFQVARVKAFWNGARWLS